MEGTLVYISRSSREDGGAGVSPQIGRKAGLAPQTPSPCTPFMWFGLILLLSMRPSSPLKRMLLLYMVELRLCFSVLQACARL